LYVLTSQKTFSAAVHCATSGNDWNVSVQSDFLLNAFKCRGMCRIMGKKYIMPDARVCGICVSVCPYGKTRYLKSLKM